VEQKIANHFIMSFLKLKKIEAHVIFPQNNLQFFARGKLGGFAQLLLKKWQIEANACSMSSASFCMGQWCSSQSTQQSNFAAEREMSERKI
jgi:hypothetical protein